MSRHTGSDWGGRRAQKWTRQVLETYGRSCYLRLPGCTRVATTGDHVIPRSELAKRGRMDLLYAVENGRPACPSCNYRRRTTPWHRLPELRGDAATLDASRFFDG